MPPKIPPQHADQIRQLVLSLVDAEKIYLLAITDRHERTASIFNKAQPTRYCGTTYHILVLLAHYDQSYRVLAGAIREQSLNWLPVTALCMDIARFLTWQDEGRYFACMVGKQAPVILG